MKDIFVLAKKEEIIEYLKKKNVKFVWFKSGIWNKYKLIEINQIHDNGYGIDLVFDDNEKTYYTSAPCSSDMW